MNGGWPPSLPFQLHLLFDGAQRADKRRIAEWACRAAGLLGAPLVDFIQFFIQSTAFIILPSASFIHQLSFIPFSLFGGALGWPASP